MILAVVIAVSSFIIFLGKTYHDIMRDKKILELKEVKDEAKEIVAKKPDSALVNDFNDRYKSDGDGTK